MGIRRATVRCLNSQSAEIAKSSGLSMLEVLITTVLISVGMTALLQFLLFALQMEARSEEFWIGTLERWNRSQEIRSSEFPCNSAEGEVFSSDVGLDLRKVEIEGDVGNVQRQWEILFVCRRGIHAD